MVVRVQVLRTMVEESVEAGREQAPSRARYLRLVHLGVSPAAALAGFNSLRRRVSNNSQDVHALNDRTLSVPPSSMLVESASLREAIASNTPLCFSASSSHPHEPFLPITPHPHPRHPILSTLRLTPPRLEDAALLQSTLNDDTVWPGMRSIPYPLQPAGVALLLEKARIAGELALQQWTVENWGALDAFPFSALRAVGASGEEEWIGGLSLRRWPYDEVTGPDEKAAKVEEMMSYADDDPRIIRTLGCEFESLATRARRIAYTHSFPLTQSTSGQSTRAWGSCQSC